MLLANGVSMPIPFADARDVVEMLVTSKRAIPFRVWSGELLAEVEAEKEANLPHNRV